MRAPAQHIEKPAEQRRKNDEADQAEIKHEEDDRTFDELNAQLVVDDTLQLEKIATKQDFAPTDIIEHAIDFDARLGAVVDIAALETRQETEFVGDDKDQRPGDNRHQQDRHHRHAGAHASAALPGCKDQRNRDDQTRRQHGRARAGDENTQSQKAHAASLDE
ncbi:MAG: hypothetical protein BGP04_13250 [Rhizobiales bacterium 62-17]|nr:MAG: hypothetical protein BGP04_13250 [Rhizobiales bacterium 62-17]